ncbi:hypothetical protein PVAND_001179 [Polypedilum vanderplanki]|uniref:Uncharacterized protein n=1 Tax=Polypedilum vanderplanki TaxID=319348 RepID=A0A9J6BNF0_POLVA|nr:hypothetical protein PVAND_001179 [Polypedilum vanderplanki]
MAKVNSWLLINLGCEMLYIIEQRLIAQNIDKEKSAQVLRDVTNALLSPNFFSYISTTFGNEIMSLQQARILLTDIACCSLMRLDVHSLDKLLDLMVMIFKWQIFLMNSPDDLLSITLRHLHGIGKIMPEKAKMLLIDQANQYFFSSWAEFTDEIKYSIVRKLNRFLAPHSIRISLLIRMKLQLKDGSFVDKLSASTHDFFRYYTQNNGENIYEKVHHFPQCQNIEKKEGIKMTQEIDCLRNLIFEVDLNEESSTFATANFKNNIDDEKKNSQQDENTPAEQQKKTLDELKKKCKLDIEEEAPPVYEFEDNFKELLNMLDNNN